MRLLRWAAITSLMTLLLTLGAAGGWFSFKKAAKARRASQAIRDVVPQDGVWHLADPGRTARFDAAAGGHSGRRHWVFEAAGPIVSSAVESGGVVIVGSTDKHVYAVEADNGSLLWKFRTGAQVVAPAWADSEQVFIGSRDSYLYAFHKQKGWLLWSLQVGSGVITSPIVVGDRILFGSEDQRINIVERGDGALLRKVELRAALVGDLAYDRGVLFYATCRNSDQPSKSSGMVQGLSLEHMEPLWRYETQSCGFVTPSVIGEQVLIKASSGELISLNRDTGEEVWRHAAGSAATAYTQSVAVLDPISYSVTTNVAEAFDYSSKERLWSVDIDTQNGVSAPVLSGSLLLYGIGKNLVAHDRWTGALNWQYTTDSGISAPAFVGEERIYIVTESGKLHAIG